MDKLFMLTLGLLIGGVAVFAYHSQVEQQLSPMVESTIDGAKRQAMCYVACYNSGEQR